jgi:hypothetical protein
MIVLVMGLWIHFGWQQYFFTILACWCGGATVFVFCISSVEVDVGLWLFNDGASARKINVSTPLKKQ